jgi:hypothetical protein
MKGGAILDIKTEVRHWLKGIDWDTEVTLTFANDISQQQAETALSRFWNRVDGELYANAVKRYGKRCERVCVLEGDGIASRYHIHIAVKCPTDRFETVTGFCDFLRKQWLEDNSNNFMCSFSPIRDRDDYTHYMTKTIRRQHCDTLILDSSHILAAA